MIGHVMDGEASEAQIAGLLIALRMKGESVDEIVGAARAMRTHAVAVMPERTDLVDTCGTGGDGLRTFNVSTAAGLVAAAAGAGVAKHGNRAVSSASGSADVLEALGVRVDLPAERVAECIDEVGFGFLFAPAHHPAMRHAGPVRRSLGVRTIFNVLGPLTNPVGARRQLVGVFDEELVLPIAETLRALGSERALVVHGSDGLDELSPCNPSTCADVTPDGVTVSTIDPASLGLAPSRTEELAGGDAAANAGPPARALRRRARPAPRRGDVECRGSARRRRPCRRSRRGPRARGRRDRRRSRTPHTRTTRGVHQRMTDGSDYLRSIGAWTREQLELRRQTRSLLEALIASGPGAVIAEVKRSSPSQGEIAPGADPAVVARHYAAGGAAAISVLTSERDFGGSYADLAAVRAAVEIPVLCKDFMVDVWQVTEARVYGADAILVILALTEDDLAADLMQAAEDQHMDALVEVHDEDELQRALQLGAVLIGVNARDLRTLEIDREHQARLLKLLPTGYLRVAESGIESAAHAAGALAAGADALLVGTALMRDPELLPTLIRGVG